jgi:LacI family transcriptional regulator
LHRAVPDVSAPLINIPFHDVGQLAGTKIAEFGHKSVAAFIGPRSEAANAYLSGFRLGLQKYQVTLSDDNVFYTEVMLISSDDYARYSEIVDRALTNLLARQDSPTAAFVTFDRMAEMIYAVATRKGLHFPDDLSLITFGESRRAGPILPHITTAAVDEHSTGRQAYRLLSAMHRGERPLVSDENLTMAICFERGSTLGPPGHRTLKHATRSRKKH